MDDPPATPQSPIIGVDTGGTFTDVILRDAQGRVRVHKLLSTPADPSEAIGDGVERVVSEAPSERAPRIVHGTTVATNALLERKGARVAFVTTAGFEDLLFLRRQNRPELYQFDIEIAPPLVDADDCLGVAERLRYDGTPIEALEAAEIERVVDRLVAEGIEAVGVCLLHAYANPEHEERLGEAIRRALPEAHVSLSSEVVREFREYERASTTVVNGFVGPVMARYLRALEERVEADRIEILQSSGGRADIAHAARYPVHTVLSGPAGGVVGALSAAREVGIDKIITFDMGGTSTDVSLCDGDVLLTSEAEIGGLPIHVPVIDIHTVGAGGGSIAHADPGGALRVGPQSAGADPGPASYGRGGREPTVTDAHVFLGRLRPEQFLGGRMRLETGAAADAVARLADELGLEPEQAAHGILDVADANMVRAIKVISLEKGFDPREFCLVAFGGAGALHACRLAAILDIMRVLVPKNPGLLSAHGMLDADSQRLYSKTFLRPVAEFFERAEAARALREELARLEEQAQRDLGESAERIAFSWSADLRYEGQSFEIGVPVDWAADADELVDPSADFESRHERLYGYRAEGREVELVTLRLKASVPSGDVQLGEVDIAGEAAAAGDGDGAGTVEVGFSAGRFATPVIARASLGDGESVDGPAVVTEYSSTTLVPPGWRVELAGGHLLLTHQASGEEGL